MPIELAVKFASEYNLKADEIKENIYRRENPNAYLASFSK